MGPPRGGDEAAKWTFHCNVADEEIDIKIVFVSCKHNAKKVLHFVRTAGAGSIVPDPNRACAAKFPDELSNVAARKVPRPTCLSNCFEKSDCVDVHNQVRQGTLGLEDKWVTQRGFFRMFCSVFGVRVIDAKEATRLGLAWLHLLAKASVKCVAGAVADDIFWRVSLTDETRPTCSIPALSDAPPGIVQVSSARASDASSVITGGSIASSAATCFSCIVPMPSVGAPPGVPECHREGHRQAETCKMSAGRKLRKRCASCNTRGLFYCFQCNKCCCKDGSSTKGSNGQPNKLRF